MNLEAKKQICEKMETREKICNQIICGGHVLTVVEEMMKMNAGDEATTNILLSMTSNLLDVSPDAIMESIDFI